MHIGQSNRSRGAQALDRLQAARAALARPATGIVAHPAPRLAGLYARGRQLLAGNFLFAGHLNEAPGTIPWELEPPSADFAAALHGFAWLDDLAAVGDTRAREAAASWVLSWIDSYGGGRGPGWTAQLTGRRLIRWIGHALLILRAQDKDVADQFYRSAAQQTIFLARRWKGADPGLARIEALTGLVYAALSLIGMERYLADAVVALGAECESHVDPSGAIASRNPEELLELFTLLAWAAAALEDSDCPPDPRIRAAMERIAPTIRALRHADGSLARFHGGGRGADGRVDWALTQVPAQGAPQMRLHMGYGRLYAGRSSVIADCAPPPAGPAAAFAHASTLAFELTSGRRPVVVSCGDGSQFGASWRRAARATPSHSTVVIDQTSSARITDMGNVGRLVDGPDDVPWDMSRADGLLRLEAGQGGWRPRFGLTHARTLDLDRDGRQLSGNDVLTTLTDGDKRLFDAALDAASLSGIPYTVHFHLHPDVNASLDMNGAAVSLGLRSGEIWVFRAEGEITLGLEPSVYLENGRLQPRPCTQVVLTGKLLSYATRIHWSFAKAQDTPIASRDTAPSEDDWSEAAALNQE